MNRHELNRGHPQFFEIFYDLRVGHAGVGAAQILRHLRVGHGHALHVGFINDRFVVGDVRGFVGTPVKERVDHHGKHGVPEGVLRVTGVHVVWFGDVIAEQ